MPRTVQHIVETHQLAQERKAAGRPVWAHHIDVSSAFHNDSLTFEQSRDRTVAILRASRWVKDADEFGQFAEAIDNLADAEDLEEFNGWWDEIYDLADYDRVWIKTRP